MQKYLFLTLALSLVGLVGCSEDDAVAPNQVDGGNDEFTVAQDEHIVAIRQNGKTPPTGLVPVAVGGSNLVCWPFTGSSFDGEGVDPVNLIFAGAADPLQVREALLSLNGDRSIPESPPIYPFDEQWHDAIGGGVQTGYDDQGGWSGSVIQLTLGDYQPVRFHLRLFRTGATTAAGEPITLGAAHFEVLIPGTSEHQVLSWEVAEQVVVGDLMRSGLLDPGQPLGRTGQINPAPSWRTIDPAIYNGLPTDLIQLIQGPAQPQSDSVPIATDGHATIVYLAGASPISPMKYATTAHVDLGQYIPRPFCSEGPCDWLYITGGVDFHTSVLVDDRGRYSYQGGYEGAILATPVDISTGQPVGDEFQADVRGRQAGWLSRGACRVVSRDRKMSHDGGGSQIDVIALQVRGNGRNGYRAFNRCLDSQ